ncbi:hypothetical protein OIC43_08210 [Streptomyces sp. NBC_00825]|uniref:hypothetical protein n=1 Tax=unclassified Streptomyces TaxID=2593676 RepID=UPI002ED449C0|nr:hypothetical protein OG832_35495 [Streptomyces sp. NBC_00826]WTH89043.1 hypothetical protein OIC43_08210 [Streptomyces sp. NBC_00825]WTH97773.1 hypothetical protein OHA23_08215 [Streptomyces sp. NBC_00822]
MSDINELGWRILREIEQDHEWRKQNPALFFAKLCVDLWRTTPDDEALEVFKIRATNAGWWASDVVDRVERVVADRPDWAAPTLECSADLWFGSPAEETPEPYLDWLAERAVELRSALDEVRRGPA